MPALHLFLTVLSLIAAVPSFHGDPPPFQGGGRGRVAEEDDKANAPPSQRGRGVETVRDVPPVAPGSAVETFTLADPRMDLTDPDMAVTSAGEPWVVFLAFDGRNGRRFDAIGAAFGCDNVDWYRRSVPTVPSHFLLSGPVRIGVAE